MIANSNDCCSGFELLLALWFPYFHSFQLFICRENLERKISARPWQCCKIPVPRVTINGKKEANEVSKVGCSFTLEMLVYKYNVYTFFCDMGYLFVLKPNWVILWLSRWRVAFDERGIEEWYYGVKCTIVLYLKLPGIQMKSAMYNDNENIFEYQLCLYNDDASL